MKNFVKFFGIIALVAVVMFGVAACDENDNPSGNSAFNGTWTNEADPDDKITITGGSNWTRTKGTHTAGTLNFESAESPNKPNIDVDGNVGAASIVGGKLHWDIGWQGAVIFAKGSGGNPGGDNPGGDNPGGDNPGGDNGGQSGGSDPRDVLIGVWNKDGAENREKLDVSKSSTRYAGYFISGMGGVSQYMFDIASYDGTTVTPASTSSYKDPFTATITEGKLTISGVPEVPAAGPYIGASNFNGTYTKQP